MKIDKYDYKNSFILDQMVFKKKHHFCNLINSYLRIMGTIFYVLVKY